MVKRLVKFPGWVIAVIFIATISCCGWIFSQMSINEASITQSFSSEKLMKEIYLYLAFIILTGINRYVSKIMKFKILNKSELILLKRVLDSKISEINRISTGKVFESSNTIAGYNTEILMTAMSSLQSWIPFFILIKREWDYNPLMAIVSVVTLVLGVTMIMLSDKLFGWNTESKEANSILKGYMADNFMNSKTIKFLGIKGFAINRMKNAQDEAIKYSVRGWQITYFRVIDLITWSALIINIWLGRSNSEMVAYIILSNFALESMRAYLSQIGEAIIDRNAELKIIASLKGNDDESSTLMGDSIDIRNVEFDYGKDSVHFNIDNLSFTNGARYLIHGESGEGKSTLANLLSGVIKPTNGHIDYVQTYYVWQETEMLDDTLWNNIVFDNPENIKETEVLELFDQLGLLSWFNELKNGFKTQIGERGCKLSSGQKQRINIVRLILTFRYKPDFLFVIDEITSNLDSLTRSRAINLINKECKSTLICISHNEGFDAICDHSILVKNHKFIKEN